MKASSAWADHYWVDEVQQEGDTFHWRFTEQFRDVFGSYHALWFALTMLSLALLASNPIPIMLGTYAGVMLNFNNLAGGYIYPWDMPAMFFFTLAVLLHLKRVHWGWLVAMITIGAMFKETVLLCSLLLLWRKLAAVGLPLILSTLLLKAFHWRVAGHFNWSLMDNPVYLKTPWHWPMVIAINAGSLVLMLRHWKERPELTLIAFLFIAGQFCSGIIDEVRIWYEILPMGWLVFFSASSSLEYPVVVRERPSLNVQQ